ncbi:MAG TPA: hypothetical protein PLR60_03145 [Syntrophorhabdaceae bacterium]|nr:hypothetical protein [Syntrophorhabdaceae bacterium]
MRISEFSKIGYFWLPASPDAKLPGTLKVSNSGEAEVEVIGVFGGITKMLDNDHNIERLNGVVEGEGLVTLEKCHYKRRNFSSQGISKSLIHVNRVFIGAHYVDGEDIKFSSLRFSLEGFDEWLSISGIKTKHGSKFQDMSIKFRAPKEIRTKLTKDIDLLFTFEWTLPGGGNVTEAKISQRALVKLVSKKLLALEDFTRLAFRLNNFFCFAMDETVTFTSFIGTSDELKQKLGDREFEVPIKIIYPSLPFSKTVPDVQWHKMVFRYGQIGNKLGKILSKWLDAYERIEPAFNLYFASTSGAHRYLESKFLSLAQAIETFHRRTFEETTMPGTEFSELVAQLLLACPQSRKEWLEGLLKYANEISLRKRLKKMIDPFKSYFGTARDRNALIGNIVNTRNYLVHYDKSLETKSLTGVELWSVCMKIEGLFQLHLLKLLGFSGDEIEAIVKNHGQLASKLAKSKNHLGLES